MIEKILSAADITFRQTRFIKPPSGTYAVYFDSVTADGPDYINRIFTHECTVEVYEPAPDDSAEERIEAAINTEGLRWTKQDRYWLQEEQRYQVVYEFTYIERR